LAVDNDKNQLFPMRAPPPTAAKNARSIAELGWTTMKRPNDVDKRRMSTALSSTRTRLA